MKKLILLTVLMCGSIYSMDDDGTGIVWDATSTLTEYQKKKLDLKRLRMAIEIKQGNDLAFHGICPECGILSNRLAHPNVRPDDRQLLCIGKCGDEKRFHQYAYFHKLQQDANATIHRLKHLLNESE